MTQRWLSFNLSDHHGNMCCTPDLDQRRIRSEFQTWIGSKQRHLSQVFSWRYSVWWIQILCRGRTCSVAVQTVCIALWFCAMWTYVHSHHFFLFASDDITTLNLMQHIIHWRTTKAQQLQTSLDDVAWSWLAEVLFTLLVLKQIEHWLENWLSVGIYHR